MFYEWGCVGDDTIKHKSLSPQGNNKYNKTKNKCQEYAKISKDKKIPPIGSYCFFIGSQLVSDFYWQNYREG